MPFIWSLLVGVWFGYRHNGPLAPAVCAVALGLYFLWNNRQGLIFARVNAPIAPGDTPPPAALAHLFVGFGIVCMFVILQFVGWLVGREL